MPHGSQIQLIKQSPFVKEMDDGDVSWSITIDDVQTGTTVSACIDVRALLDSLGEQCGDAPLLTCGCGEAECARIYHEHFDCGDDYIH